MTVNRIPAYTGWAAASAQKVNSASKDTADPQTRGAADKNAISADLPRHRPDESLYTNAAKFRTNGAVSAERKDALERRREKLSEPCETCRNRSYKDGSGESVSFKNGASVSPYAAVGQISSHEREHAGNARDRDLEEGGRSQATVRVKTSICPECHKVYVSGGETRVQTLSPPQVAKRYQDQMGIGGGAGA